MTTPKPIADMKPWERYEQVSQKYADSEHHPRYKRMVRQRLIYQMTRAIQPNEKAGPSDFLNGLRANLASLDINAGSHSFDQAITLIQDALAANDIYLSRIQVEKYFKVKTAGTKEIDISLLDKTTNEPLDVNDNNRHKLYFQILHDALSEYLQGKDKTLKDRPESTVAVYQEMLARVSKIIGSMEKAKTPYKSLNDLSIELDSEKPKKTWDELVNAVKLDTKAAAADRNNYLALEFYRLHDTAEIRSMQDKSNFVTQHKQLQLGAPGSLRISHVGGPRRGESLFNPSSQMRLISIINMPFTIDHLRDCINDPKTKVNGKDNPFVKLPKFKIGDGEKIYRFVTKQDSNGILKWYKQEVELVAATKQYANKKINGKEVEPSVFSQYEMAQMKNADGNAAITDFFDQVGNAIDEMIKAYDFNLTHVNTFTDATVVSDPAKDQVVITFDKGRLGASDPQPAPALSAGRQSVYVALLWANILKKALDIKSEENFIEKVKALIKNEQKIYPGITSRVTDIVSNNEAAALHEMVEKIREELKTIESNSTSILPTQLKGLQALVDAYDELMSKPNNRTLFTGFLDKNKNKFGDFSPPALDLMMVAEQMKTTDQKPLVLFSHQGDLDVHHYEIQVTGIDYLTFGFGQYLNGGTEVDIQLGSSTYRFVEDLEKENYRVFLVNSDNTILPYIPLRNEEENHFRAALAQKLLEKACESLPRQKDEIEKVRMLVLPEGKNSSVKEVGIDESLYPDVANKLSNKM